MYEPLSHTHIEQIQMTEIERKIDLFFKNPNDFNTHAGIHSTLYLLRRDTSLCLGYDPNNNQKLNFEALFPGTMAILAGIDLLAKFCYGDSTKRGEVGKRFRDYIRDYLDNYFAEELYQLRNALLHSFGLYSKANNGKVYNFVLTRGLDRLVKKETEITYLVDINILWKMFEESINKYLKDLRSDETLQRTFLDMFVKYGVIGIK